MPTRATKRGAERTSLGERDCDVLVCGASFAGLAVARELAGSGMRVLMIDRYEIGERQTSACAMPTVWLEAMDLLGSLRQTFYSLLVHTRARTSRWRLPWSFSTFDYRELCALLYAQAGAGGTEFVEFETATVTGSRRADRPHRPWRAHRATDRRRARLAPGAVGRDRDPAAERAAVARSGGSSRRRER